MTVPYCGHAVLRHAVLRHNHVMSVADLDLVVENLVCVIVIRSARQVRRWNAQWRLWLRRSIPCIPLRQRFHVSGRSGCQSAEIVPAFEH